MKSNESEPVSGLDVGVRREPEMQRLAQELVDSAQDHGLALTGENGLLTALTKQVLQAALEAEMTHHLGYERHDRVGHNRENSRNGSTPKTVTTEIGKMTINVPRDREGTFEPQIVPKHQRRLAGFDDAVISLYSKGMTTGDIVSHLEEVYDTTISRDLVSTVTARVGEEMRLWQNRPLDPIYPVVIIDAIVMKVAGWVDKIENDSIQVHPIAEHLESGTPDIAGHILQRWMSEMRVLSADAQERGAFEPGSLLPQARAIAVFSSWISAMFVAKCGGSVLSPDSEDGPGLQILSLITSGTL
jgi:hypothetical protein